MDIRRTGGHCWAGLLCAAFGDYTVEFIQIRIEVKYCGINVSISSLVTQGNGWYVLLTATHSMISTYLGSMTIVLKLPFTSADSTKGLHRYKGFDGADPEVGDGGTGGGGISGGKVADVGVGDLFGPRG